MSWELEPLRTIDAHTRALAREMRVRTRGARDRARRTREISRTLRSCRVIVRARAIIARHRPLVIAGGSDADGHEAKVVLLVDDHVDTREMYAEFLRAMGFETLQASTCEEALATSRRRAIDAVVLDRRLPDGDGDEVCRALKADTRTRGLPVVMLSGRQPDGTTGADVYLVKPVIPEDLVRHLNALLASRDGHHPSG